MDRGIPGELQSIGLQESDMSEWLNHHYHLQICSLFSPQTTECFHQSPSHHAFTLKQKQPSLYHPRAALELSNRHPVLGGFQEIPGVIKYLHTNGFDVKFWKGWKVCHYRVERSLRTPSLVGALVSPLTLEVPILRPPLSPEHVWLSVAPVSGTCWSFCCNPFPASFSGGTFIFSFGPKLTVLSSKFLSPSTQNLRWLTSQPSASLQLHPLCPW